MVLEYHGQFGQLIYFNCDIYMSVYVYPCCIRCGPNEERVVDFVPREDGDRNSG